MKKYKIGYTTGTFDMFHIGHLNTLKKSKELCDYLIVGVSTDELVKQYKNKLPIIPLKDRMAIVEAIKYVDKVVIQDNLDKYGAYLKYHYDVLFHGDDWKDSDLYKGIENKLREVGVDAIYFPCIPLVSTSYILNKIRQEK